MTNWKELLYQIERDKSRAEKGWLPLVDKLSPEEKELLEDILEQDSLQSSIDLLESVDAESDWEHLAAKVTGLPGKEARILAPRTSPWWKRAGRYAAALALPLLAVATAIYLYNSHHFSTPLEEHEFPELVHEGGVLVLADGTRMDLQSISEPVDGEEYQVISQSRVTERWAADNAEPAYHRVIIPRGSEYRLQLADGSQVHLNSESELRFPHDFSNQDTRQVFLDKGEAFFEITKNEQLPFIVHSKGLDIEVLGTSFNINTYNFPRMVTTLVSGKIQASFQGKTGHLLPNQQLLVDEKDAEFSISNVDVSAAIGWHQNQWIFDQMPLGQVMENLGRWYDYEVVFVDKSARDLLYTADLQKYIAIDTLLGLIEKTGSVYFTIKGKTIFIHKH